MIEFNIPPFIGNEYKYIREAVERHHLCGDGLFTHRCNHWIEKKTGVMKALLTTSCTHALEMAAILADIKDGDEVIMPSFTFVSTANAFVLRGAKIIFVDIRPDTMNIDEKLVESAVTKKTRAIIPVHYAGVPCEMDELCYIADKYHLVVVEDAAQAIMSEYKEKAAGSIGDFGCFSFHETKNLSMGEGGAILVRNKDKIERAEIIREKGTNRTNFYRGKIDKYTWVDKGSSYLPSDINAAYLWTQLLSAEDIQQDRMKNWNLYYEKLKPIEKMRKIELPKIPKWCKHNAHMFYIKTKDINERQQFIRYMNVNEIHTAFHYVPLHSSFAGKKYGRFHGEDRYTTRESERLVRLPLFYGMKQEQVEEVCFKVQEFYKEID